MKTLSLLAAAALTAALFLPSPALAAPGDLRPKQQAPVIIDAQIDGTIARVSLKFPRGGSGVEVHATGAEGLVVQGEAHLVKGRTFAKGEALSFDVSIVPGLGQSLLAVHVSGAFGGARRSTVRAFPVGLRSAEQRAKAEAGAVKVGGENVRLVPAQERKR